MSQAAAPPGSGRLRKEQRWQRRPRQGDRTKGGLVERRGEEPSKETKGEEPKGTGIRPGGSRRAGEEDLTTGREWGRPPEGLSFPVGP